MRSCAVLKILAVSSSLSASLALQRLTFLAFPACSATAVLPSRHLSLRGLASAVIPGRRLSDRCAGTPRIGKRFGCATYGTYKGYGPGAGSLFHSSAVMAQTTPLRGGGESGDDERCRWFSVCTSALHGPAAGGEESVSKDKIL